MPTTDFDDFPVVDDAPKARMQRCEYCQGDYIYPSKNSGTPVDVNCITGRSLHGGYVCRWCWERGAEQ